MRLVTADPEMVIEILDSTYPIWGEGLSREAYDKWYRAQRETAWGRGHLSRLALVDDSGVLASTKRYGLDACIEGRPAPVLGIGAVFTPPSRRGQGYAPALIEALIDDAADRGCELALLFSEIGSTYYERLGFRVIPQWEQTIEVIPSAGAPAALVRSGETRDFDVIADLAARTRARAAFAIDRRADFFAFVLARRRLLAGLGPIGLRSVEFFVTEEANRAVAFVVLTRGPHGLVLEDFGDRDPSGARVGAMLQILAARTPAERPMIVRGRVPAGFLPPQWRLVSQAPAAEIMMVRGIGTHATPAFDPDAVVYPNLDVF